MTNNGNFGYWILETGATIDVRNNVNGFFVLEWNSVGAALNQLLIDNKYIFGHNDYAIYLRGTNKNIAIRNVNLSRDGTGRYGYGIYNQNALTDLTVNGVIVENREYGIYFHPTYANVNTATVMNSTFRDNNYGVLIANTNNLIFAQNSVYDNGSYNFSSTE